jgi:uncharacterized protein (TIGR02118 family)
MIKVTVLYPNEAGKRFNWDYYLNKHYPLVKQRLGDKAKDIRIDAGLAKELTGQEPAYVAMFHIVCDSLEEFQAGLNPHAAEIFGDVPNYTDIQPIMQMSEVKI